MHSEVIGPEPRALIVEDEALIAEELRERLSRMGFVVIATVDSAEESFEIVTREHVDLVLMDIRLKGHKDGVHAARDIRRHVDIPIIFLTAHSDRITIERAKETEHDGFILKPFHRSELQSTIEVAMKRYALRRRRERPC